MEDDTAAWHVDRRVPLALIATIVMQTIAVVWWASGLSNRVDVLERQVNSYAPQSERLIRLETKMEAVQNGIVEIKNLIRRNPQTDK